MSADPRIHHALTENYDMDLDTLIFSFPHDESSTPVRITSALWTRIQAAAQAHGGLLLERYGVSDARAFARAVRAALESPPPAVEQPRRFAVFQQPRPDPGVPLREPEVREDVQNVLRVFDAGGVLVQPRATPTALRALPDRGVAGAGEVGKKMPLAKPAPAG
ncbi:hypothetical protein [Cylindrospermum sp. FACHB-282]|uniref:hypothetical protein n=1 Tax=Cylindrospermum sp. FACHB-282 TaxID=2692794 RepID=UPI001683DABE|nr:hypothetical protein [Cylindrospermum sp. FACHB-282]MBD2388829.1 hypothetical protein [Cylindrospermum sp. FACHB-282]